MFTAMGYGVYIFFASLMVLSIFFIFVSTSIVYIWDGFECWCNLPSPTPQKFLLPETKQVPLENMDDLFAPGLFAWRAHGVVMRRIAEGTVQEVVNVQSPLEQKDD